MQVINLWVPTSHVYFNVPTSIRTGRLRYLSRPICLIDILILIVTAVVMIVSSGHLLTASTIQNLRFLKILRLLQIDRQMTTWKLIRKMIQHSKFELVSAYYFAALLFMLLAVSVYTTEGMGEGVDLDVKGEMQSGSIRYPQWYETRYVD